MGRIVIAEVSGSSVKPYVLVFKKDREPELF
jgi:hypothetical protein